MAGAAQHIRLASIRLQSVAVAVSAQARRHDAIAERTSRWIGVIERAHIATSATVVDVRIAARLCEKDRMTSGAKTDRCLVDGKYIHAHTPQPSSGEELQSRKPSSQEPMAQVPDEHRGSA